MMHTERLGELQLTILDQVLSAVVGHPLLTSWLLNLRESRDVVEQESKVVAGSGRDPIQIVPMPHDGMEVRVPQFRPLFAGHPDDPIVQVNPATKVFPLSH